MPPTDRKLIVPQMPGMQELQGCIGCSTDTFNLYSSNPGRASL
jgi:hypothetical protein